MLIEAGPPGVASFTDDSSPDSRKTGGTKVSIHAQVLRDEPLEWYFQLISFYPDVPGELKSTRILSGFQNLPPEVRRRVWTGLGRVRIHISDPRPYRERLEQTLAEVWKLSNAAQILQAAARRGDSGAQELQTLLEQTVARQIIFDSPAHRLAALVLWPEDYSEWLERDPLELQRRFDPDKDLESFLSKTDRALVRRISHMTSKSSSAFADALEAALRLPDEEEARYQQFFSYGYLQRRVLRALQPGHAFDEGDEFAFKHIQMQRNELISLTDDLNLIGGTAVQPLVTFDSKSSLFGQASDISARFAASLYERDGVVAVAKQFEYVTFNGERINAETAEEHLRRCREIDIVG